MHYDVVATYDQIWILDLRLILKLFVEISTSL